MTSHFRHAVIAEIGDDREKLRKRMTSTPCIISVADHAGWAHFVCVAAADDVPAVVDRRRVVTIDAGLPTMPYHHESLSMRENEADALIAPVRQSINARTSDSLRQIVADLAPSYRVVAVAIREPPFPALPDTVAVVRRPTNCSAPPTA